MSLVLAMAQDPADKDCTQEKQPKNKQNHIVLMLSLKACLVLACLYTGALNAVLVLAAATVAVAVVVAIARLV